MAALTQNRQQNVDEEVGAAAALEEDSNGGQDDGKNDLANVTGAPVSVATQEQRGTQVLRTWR